MRKCVQFSNIFCLDKGRRIMKKRILLLLFSLSCVTQLPARDKKIVKKIDPAARWILQDKSLSARKRIKLLKCCGFDANEIACQRGETGKRGRKGRKGPAGANACGLGELFLNAPMLASSGEGLGYPPDNSFTPYSPIDTNIPAWQVRQSVFEDTPVEGIFNIPIDLDRTQPVTAVIHFLVPSFPVLIGAAKIRIDMIYLPNSDLLGFISPATGFDDTQLSADFIVMNADPAASNNMRHVSVSVALDPTKIDGEWAFIGVSRTAPATTEFDSPIYLSTISIQYTRTCS